MDTKIKNGNFAEIILWLKKNIHNHGSMYSSDELLKKAINKRSNSKDLISYLNKKYIIEWSAWD